MGLLIVNVTAQCIVSVLYEKWFALCPVPVVYLQNVRHDMIWYSDLIHQWSNSNIKSIDATVNWTLTWRRLWIVALHSIERLSITWTWTWQWSSTKTFVSLSCINDEMNGWHCDLQSPVPRVESMITPPTTPAATATDQKEAATETTDTTGLDSLDNPQLGSTEIIILAVCCKCFNR